MHDVLVEEMNEILDNSFYFRLGQVLEYQPGRQAAPSSGLFRLAPDLWIVRHGKPRFYQFEPSDVIGVASPCGRARRFPGPDRRPGAVAIPRPQKPISGFRRTAGHVPSG